MSSSIFIQQSTLHCEEAQTARAHITRVNLISVRMDARSQRPSRCIYISTKADIANLYCWAEMVGPQVRGKVVTGMGYEGLLAMFCFFIWMLVTRSVFIL